MSQIGSQALQAFQASLDAEVKQILNQDVVPFIQRKVESIASALIAATPIDTGLARGNWQVTLEAPATALIKRFDRGRLGNPSGPVLDEARKVIRQIDLSTKTIFISNMADYISYIIEDGTSQQAAPGTLSNILFAESLRP